jgi:hypothetical protein
MMDDLVVYYIDDRAQRMLILFVRERADAYRDLDRLDPELFADYVGRSDERED